MVPLPVAEAVSFWANEALIAALALGVLATLAVVVTGNIKEAYWTAARDAAAERISANEAETNRAKESAAQAEARAAEATERTVKAQVELEQLKVQMGRRPFNVEAFRKALDGKPKALSK